MLLFTPISHRLTWCVLSGFLTRDLIHDQMSVQQVLTNTQEAETSHNPVLESATSRRQILGHIEEEA